MLTLAQNGVAATMIERDVDVRDAICGGFMSWRTLASLERVGVGVSGHRIRRVVLFAGGRRAEAPLPGEAVGLSRRTLDRAMQHAVGARGSAIERGIEAKEIANGVVRFGDGSMRTPDAVFLAVGKHDLRGAARPRTAADPTLGLRVRIPPHPGLSRLVGDTIELHLFDRGYVGLSIQEDGSANLCLAVRKSRLAEADGRPETLLEQIGATTPLGDRLAFADATPVDAIAAVPYGWGTATTLAGVFRLGDQAAVIPSLAGEGIGIAIASGIAAANAYAAGGRGAAGRYQRDFARRSRRPVRIASALWHQAERPRIAQLAVPLVGLFPALAGFAARATRIGD
jgi:menaquinone-9 beta-reductase